MTQLMESPFLILAVGVMTVILLGSGWMKTGHPALIYALLGAVVVFAGLLIAERCVKTDKEQLRETLYEIADDVQRNDLPAVLGHIHSRARRVRSRARNEMPLYHFHDVAITTIRDISLHPDRDPPSATAEFLVRVDLTFRDGTGGRDRFVRFVVVTFYREEERWKVWDYEHYDFLKAFQRRRQQLGRARSTTNPRGW